MTLPLKDKFLKLVQLKIKTIFKILVFDSNYNQFAAGTKNKHAVHNPIVKLKIKNYTSEHKIQHVHNQVIN